MKVSCVVVDNHQNVRQTVFWTTIAKIPMESTLVVKLQMFSREGEGGCWGGGAIKLFDQNGFLRQG